MKKLSNGQVRIALLSVALFVASACSSSAQVTTSAGSAASNGSTTQGSPVLDSVTGEIRVDGAPLASKMGVCDAVAPALIEQWVGIEETIYASFGAQSDGCQWIGDNWNTEHGASTISMIIHTQQSYESRLPKTVPYVGGPDGSLLHNNVHIYLEHEGTFVSFWVIPTREGPEDSTHPDDHVELHNDVIAALLPLLSGIEKA